MPMPQRHSEDILRNFPKGRMMKKNLGCVLALTLLSISGLAAAQTTAKQLLGGWSLVSLETDTADGRIQAFGPRPIGYINFGPDGRIAAQFMRPDIPKIAANNRQKATQEENVAIAQGVMAFFGEWKLLDPKTGEISLHVIGSSFPNWNGTDQKRFIKVRGDAMTIINPSSPSAGTSTVMLTRLK